MIGLVASALLGIATLLADAAPAIASPPAVASPSSSASPPAAASARPAAQFSPRLSEEELELLRRSLRPSGLAELESHSAPLGQLPLSEVEASLDLEQGHLDGHLRLIYTNRESAPLHDLVLRLLPAAPMLKSSSGMRCDSVLVDGQPARTRAHGSLLEIDLPVPLAPLTSLALSLSFHGKLTRLRPGDDSLAPSAQLLAQLAPGLGALGGATTRSAGQPAGYGTFAVSGSGALLLDWYPLLAARVGGAWDRTEVGPLGDPLRADVGSAIVALTVPHGLRVIGAGVELGQHESGTAEVAAFALAGLRGSLGLAVMRDASIATDLVRPEGDSSADPVRLRIASLHGPQGARAMLTCARAALSVLAPRWGPYPWSDFVLAEMPLTGGAGGVEQSGMAVVARALGGGVTDPLAPAQDATDPLPEAPGIFRFTCHHEVAHQWFPGVVGSDPRGTPWLDEALAQDGAVRVAEAAGGIPAGQAAARRFVALNYQGMRMMGLPDGRADRRTDEFKSSIAYAGLVYGKVPLYLARVRALVGDETFDSALRSLRAQRAFREASGADLLNAFKRADPARTPQLDALAERWLRERHGDEDIGEADLADLMEGMAGGMGGSGSNTAQLAQLMRLLGSLGSVGSPNRNGSALDPDPTQPGATGHRSTAAEERELRRAIEQMERTVPELKQLLDQMGAGTLRGP